MNFYTWPSTKAVKKKFKTVWLLRCPIHSVCLNVQRLGSKVMDAFFSWILPAHVVNPIQFTKFLVKFSASISHRCDFLYYTSLCLLGTELLCLFLITMHFLCTCGGIHPGRVEPASPFGDVSWVGSTPRSPLPASLYLFAFQLKSSLPCVRAPERLLFKHPPLWF